MIVSFENDIVFGNAISLLKNQEMVVFKTTINRVFYPKTQNIKTEFLCEILSHKNLTEELLVLKHYNSLRINSYIFIELFILLLKGETSPLLKECYNNLYSILEI